MEENVALIRNVFITDGQEKRNNNESKGEPIRNVVKREKKDFGFSFLPTSMFQLKYDGRDWDDNYKARKYKCLIDGCSKIICVSHNSRCNAKRHVKLCHPKKLNDYVILVQEENQTKKKMLENERKRLVEGNLPRPSDRFQNWKIRTQGEFDNVVLRFIVGRILPLTLQEFPSLSAYNNMFSCEFVLQTTDFYNNLLAVKYQERKEDLIAALQNATWVSTTTDCWSTYGKYFIGNTVQWYDDNLQRHQACLGVRKLVGKLDYVSLANNLLDIYKEFKIENKIEATVTDGGSDFIEKLMLQSYLSQGDGIISEDSYEDDPDIILPTQDKSIGYSGLSYTCYKMSVFDILDQPASNKGGGNRSASLITMEDSYRIPTYRQCSAHLLKTIITDDTKNKIEDKFYKRILYSTNRKITAICIKQFESYENSCFIKSSIGCLFAIIDQTEWNSYFDRMKCFSKLLIEKKQDMQTLFKALGLIWFRENEQEFIHEYVQVLQPIVDAVFLLNGEVSLPLSYLLPTLTILRHKLASLQQDKNIKHSKALVCSLLTFLQQRFGPMYNIPELRVAAVCDPKYKDQWLNPEERDTYRKLLQELYDQGEMEINEEETDSSGSKDVFAVSNSTSSSPKNPNNFNSSHDKKTEKDKIESEVDCFFADPLGDHHQLLKYPLLMKIFRKYNAVSSSSAFVERLFKKVGMVFTSKPFPFSEKRLDMLIFLNINDKESCSW